MVFSSPLFLFLFLPAVLLTQLLVARANVSLRNGLLLIASLLFYSWGEPIFILLMLGSIFLNYLFGLAISKAKSRQRSTAPILTLGVSLNLGALALFKYAGFIVENLNPLFITIGLPELSPVSTHLPLGISFYTFQAISYLVDISRGAAPVQHNLATTALYISLFPQLIAGPIVRYHQIASQLIKISK